MDRFAFDPAICRQCKGLCCQGHPGAWAEPERFAGLYLQGRPAPPEALGELLAVQKIALRDFGGVSVPAPFSNEEGCIFRSPTGCTLAVERRPEQCLALIPDIETLIEGECRCRLPAEFTYGAIRLRWAQWWASLRSLSPAAPPLRPGSRTPPRG